MITGLGPRKQIPTVVFGSVALVSWIYFWALEVSLKPTHAYLISGHATTTCHGTKLSARNELSVKACNALVA